MLSVKKLTLFQPQACRGETASIIYSKVAQQYRHEPVSTLHDVIIFVIFVVIRFPHISPLYLKKINSLRALQKQNLSHIFIY